MKLRNDWDKLLREAAELIATELLSGLHKIEQSKNWGEKINGFPWSYVPVNDADTNKLYITVENWLKKNNGKLSK